MPNNGLVSIRSARSVTDALAAVEAALSEKGLMIFARIDHAAGAAEAGMPLRPTILIIFGNPRAGTPLMQAKQTVGIDLPLKLLVWEDEEGAVWLTYNDPTWLVRRHKIGADAGPAVDAMGALLAAIARSAM
ncbi:MAG TPA: DUF302 domain-containing protein [Methylocella sp.]|nr:DUF302 domain-containing protein [Methylocella sp.]